jgi:glutathione peroxidase
MKKIIGTLLIIATSLSFADECPEVLDFSAPRLRASENIEFCKAFADKALLVVNTASRCGFTSQFKELEELYQEYKDEGLAIVGFPSNDFRQEYGDEEKTAEVCYVNYGVTFDMVAESSVTGLTANKFFQRLRKQTGESPSWNFNKFLISPDGNQIQHFSSSVSPKNGKLEEAVRAML